MPTSICLARRDIVLEAREGPINIL